ncbi:hypothetical protein OKW42_004545 [Paraburkholderia sp. WC7.3d]
MSISNMSGMPSADGALLIDLYELTMLQAYFERGMNELGCSNCSSGRCRRSAISLSQRGWNRPSGT